MCPFCFATLGLIAASATSAGGVTALALKVSRKKNEATETIQNSNQRRNQDVAVSRAPLAEIEAFKKRIGWGFKWVSSFESDFNYDYHVSFTKEELAQGKAYYNFEVRDLPYPSEEVSGVSVFYKDAAGNIFHTYSCYARGDEGGLGTYFYLDLTPKGRNETGPFYNLADWVRHHDRYEAGGHVASTGRYVPPPAGEDTNSQDARRLQG